MLTGKCLITGGSGFLARAIYRRARRENWPVEFTCYSRDEAKQWQLARVYPGVHCVLGDISRDLDRLTAVMAGHDTVIHAGAVKFIPEAEWNVSETIDVNVNGSRNVAIAARAAGVKKVIGISTDKACAPLNTYGMTKALMERYFGEADRMGDTRFVTVRYGNVVGSTGSVIPVFKQQIEDKGELKITDNRMTRFWLSVDEAIDLILWANDCASEYGGQTFINPCPAMKIVDLAEAVWYLTGQSKDIRINYTGIRPGEKLHEALFNEQEAPRVSIIGQKGYVMAPPTAKPTIPDMMAYSSDHPRRWISVDEMQELIKDAESV
jgi:UDP-N-acetylglucosamine 4,6-dehydratase